MDRIPYKNIIIKIRGGLIFIKETSYEIEKMYLQIPPRAPHTYDFVVLTSLTHPRKIILVVLQIGKAKDLSAPLRNRPILKNYEILPSHFPRVLQSFTLPYHFDITVT
jgi:hypothetical protein